ncbi:MAG: hypothetical protein NZ529_00440 [Cytophagaceae bacterium]|nr:hypothetical protein [Cytophagaceae bacterium]MDW8455232.1 hypothetical protein [Cytophagaceae bacterium]
MLALCQSSQEPFGKNRIQKKALNWRYISSYHFEVYYYGDSKELATKALLYAEEDVERIAEIVGSTLAKKIKIILYNSVTDMLQSNMGLGDQSHLPDGQTVLVKSNVEVAFKGSQLQLMKDISYGIAYSLINDMMYGGSVKDILQSSYLLTLPEWFISGASSFISEDWNQEMDNYMRDLAIRGKLKNPATYKGNDARLIGHSIWNYIDKVYGHTDASNVLTLTRVFRNEEESIENNLNISYKTFVRNWKAYYKSINAPLVHSRQTYDSLLLVRKNRKNITLANISLSPDATMLAYSQNVNGRFKIILRNLKNNKQKVLFVSGYKRIDQQIDDNNPRITWIDSKTIAYTYTKVPCPVLVIKNIETGKTVKRNLSGLRQILSMSASYDGKYIVLSADKSGQADLFMLPVQSSSYTQLTYDWYDDLHPSFVENTYNIVFSSNRLDDTLLTTKGIPEFSDPYDLYVFNTTKKTIKKFNLPYNNTNPISGGDNRYYFLSDASGIDEIKVYSSSAVSTNSVLTTLYDVTDFDVKKNKIVYVSTRKGIPQLYSIDLLSYKNEEQENAITERRRYINSVFGFDNNTMNEKKDSIETDIRVEDVVFESDSMKKANIQDKPLVPDRSVAYKGPYSYRYPIAADIINSNIFFDQLRGIGLVLQGGISDMLGHHRMNGGGFLSFDFRSNKWFAEYEYLEKRIDFKLRYDRHSLNAINEYAYHHYVYNDLRGSISFPLSVYQRISLSPFIANTRFSELSNFYTITLPDKVRIYPGAKVEYVIDNTQITGPNMMKGFRAKAYIEQYGLNDKNPSQFNIAMVDVRAYIPVHKEIVFASRISYGRYGGNARKNFLLGGMDNWFLSNREFTSTINNRPFNPLTIDYQRDNSDILFLRFATSMRGFRYNTLFGPKYLMGNFELRWPVVQYFHNGVVRSNFLRTLELIGFTDIGTAYDGKNPFSTENTRNTQNISGNPFTATVTNYRSPFIYGYGLGVRCYILGYYIKTDLGWGLQDKKVQPPILYLTFGYDF